MSLWLRVRLSGWALLGALLGALLWFTSPAMAQQRASALVAPVQLEEATPEWLAWRIFHESLASYARQSPARASSMLARQAGLQDGDVVLLLAAGPAYLSELRDIDAAARAEVDRLY